nr:MAG TPA_asm: hypothetical protein [Bacteriophage sp.]
MFRYGNIIRPSSPVVNQLFYVSEIFLAKSYRK